MNTKPIVITSGDPTGIGPDIILDIAQKHFNTPLVILGDEQLFQARARKLNKPFSFSDNITFKHIPMAGTSAESENQYVFELLNEAAKGCLNQHYAGMVTAPVNKAKLNKTHPFTGHTEWLAHFCGVKKVVMCLSNPQLTVALTTTHLPLREVSNAITKTVLTETLEILHTHFGSKKIIVCGLNPHAGENGLLGDEEKKIIEPVINAFQKKGMNVVGPSPADTAFSQALKEQIPLVLAMYHDQGLAPIKTIDFENTVNITLGLPFIRTSVDHGTAYNLVGTGKASSNSLFAAINTAIEYAQT